MHFFLDKSAIVYILFEPDVKICFYVCTTSCNKEKQNKPHSYKPEGCATIKCLDTANTREKVTSVKKLTNEVTDSNPTKVADIFIPCIYSNSSHRDGAIYKNKLFMENWFDIDITDHNESMYPNY